MSKIFHTKVKERNFQIQKRGRLRSEGVEEFEKHSVFKGTMSTRTFGAQQTCLKFVASFVYLRWLLRSHCWHGKKLLLSINSCGKKGGGQMPSVHPPGYATEHNQVFVCMLVLAQARDYHQRQVLSLPVGKDKTCLSVSSLTLSSNVSYWQPLYYQAYNIIKIHCYFLAKFWPSNYLLVKKQSNTFGATKNRHGLSINSNS